MSAEVWIEQYDRLAELIRAHRTTLVFVNTRRLAERAARHLAERLGEDAVTSHHGSLAKEHRLKAEERLKAGQLKALVATASLELGIDIGDVDLVCQLGSPHGDRGVPAARRPLGPRARARAERPAVPAVARRSRRVHGAAREHPPRASSTRSSRGRAARRARAADRRRGRRAGVEASRTCTGASRTRRATGPIARRVRRRRAHGRGRLHDASRPAQRAPALRPRQQRAARPARRAR